MLKPASLPTAADVNGIAVERPTAKGPGPYGPVASNRTDKGQAENRRVEMVER